MKPQNNKPITYRGHRIIIPDDVMIRDGIACGDTICMVGALNDGIIEFRMEGDACRLSQRSMEYLAENFNLKAAEYVLGELKRLMELFSAEPTSAFNTLGIPVALGRIECVISPFELLYDFVRRLTREKIEIYGIADTSQNLDCDACVSTGRVVWNTEITTRIETEPFEEYSDDTRRLWMSGAKIVLSDDEARALEEAYPQINNELLDFMERKKIDQMVYYNIMHRTNVEIEHDFRWRSLFYREYRMRIVKSEVDGIRDFITDSGITAGFIKGSRNLGLYEGRGLRLFLDYDILCGSFEDAFKLGSYLFGSGFSIFPGVFSLKENYAGGKRILCGHFHVQKIILNRFKIIIDVSCPAFPLGRIGLFYPELENGGISAEDNMIISICHTFKHRDVFMKDVNDVYLALRLLELRLDVLYRRIRENKMELFCAVIFEFIFRNYDMESDFVERFKESVPLDYGVFEKYNGWPYKRDDVYNVKRDDLDNRLVNATDNPRTYLYPLAAFSKHFDHIDAAKPLLEQAGFGVRVMESVIFEVSKDDIHLFLIPMGVFIDSSSDGVKLKRVRVQNILNELLDVINAPKSLLIPFAIRTDEDWF